MLEEFKYLLSEITVYESKEHGATIKLTDYEHSDYIEDVLVEYFDIEYEYKICNHEKSEYILCFAKKATTKQVEKAVIEINSYHNENRKIYETI
ncbi:hypothetical protein MNBD_GAMMA11-579 [hydrothermal vent metagenome]|uniref:Uncharacterized protein n=1 Tax=hydrothermal vent metagenome TaxID=652676 RepID=A0A3B0Y7Q6_9ZZZZ